MKPTTSNALVYVREKTFTNLAASVAEGAAKQGSTLVFDHVTPPGQKLAHWLPVAKRTLEGAPKLGSCIDARRRLGLV